MAPCGGGHQQLLLGEAVVLSGPSGEKNVSGSLIEEWKQFLLRGVWNSHSFFWGRTEIQWLLLGNAALMVPFHGEDVEGQQFLLGRGGRDWHWLLLKKMQ